MNALTNLRLVRNPLTIAKTVCGNYPKPVLIPNPFSKMLFDVLIAQFNRLLADPDREQWILDPETHNNGLIRRDPTEKEPDIDPKWMWHYSMSEFWDHVKKMGLNTAKYRMFLTFCDYVIHTGIKNILPIVKALDAQLPGYAFERNFLAGDHFLRLIKGLSPNDRSYPQHNDDLYGMIKTY